MSQRKTGTIKPAGFTERISKQERSDGMTPLVATITNRGVLCLPDGYEIKPREARRFAHWILSAYPEEAHE